MFCEPLIIVESEMQLGNFLIVLNQRWANFCRKAALTIQELAEGRIGHSRVGRGSHWPFKGWPRASA